MNIALTIYSVMRSRVAEATCWARGGLIPPKQTVQNINDRNVCNNEYFVSTKKLLWKITTPYIAFCTEDGAEEIHKRGLIDWTSYA